MKNAAAAPLCLNLILPCALSLCQYTSLTHQASWAIVPFWVGAIETWLGFSWRTTFYLHFLQNMQMKYRGNRYLRRLFQSAGHIPIWRAFAKKWPSLSTTLFFRYTKTTPFTSGFINSYKERVLRILQMHTLSVQQLRVSQVFYFDNFNLLYYLTTCAPT